MLNLNVAFLCGDKGEKVVSSYDRMLNDFNDMHTDLGPNDKFQASAGMICAQADACRRLVFPAQDPKRVLFKACGKDGTYNEQLVKSVFDDLSERARLCEHCIDECFTRCMLGCGRVSLPSMHDLLCDIASKIQISSSIVEKFHLLGEESKPKRGRGRAVSAERLPDLTYQASVCVEAEHLQNEVRTQVFKTHGLSAKQFSRMNSALYQDAAMTSVARRGARLSDSVGETKTNRKSSRWQAFRKQHWTPGLKPTSHAGLLEQRRISALWKQLNEDQKSFYDAVAEGHDMTKASLAGQSLGELKQHGRCSAARSARRSAHRTVWSDLINHPAWKAGAGTVTVVLGHITEGLFSKDLKCFRRNRFGSQSVLI